MSDDRELRCVKGRTKTLQARCSKSGLKIHGQEWQSTSSCNQLWRFIKNILSSTVFDRGKNT